LTKRRSAACSIRATGWAFRFGDYNNDGTARHSRLEYEFDGGQSYFIAAFSEFERER
jgi:hypothetical protein